MSPGRFFISTLPVGNNNEIVQQYHQHLTSPWFSGQSERENKPRGTLFSDEAHTEYCRFAGDRQCTVDFQNYWYGVLSMSFPVSSMKALLTEARQSQDKENTSSMMRRVANHYRRRRNDEPAIFL
jgi:hypothetical protein